MPGETLEQFRRMVPADHALREKLWQATECEEFIALVVQSGNERGFYFTREEVAAMLSAEQSLRSQAVPVR